VSVEPELEFRDATETHLYELQIEPRASIHLASLPDGMPPHCPACGRRGLKKPEHVIVRADSILPDVDIFRLRDLPTMILGTERLMQTARELGLTGALFDPLEVME
jgi:hypothetical protein